MKTTIREFARRFERIPGGVSDWMCLVAIIFMCSVLWFYGAGLAGAVTLGAVVAFALGFIFYSILRWLRVKKAVGLYEYFFAWETVGVFMRCAITMTVLLCVAVMFYMKWGIDYRWLIDGSRVAIASTFKESGVGFGRQAVEFISALNFCGMVVMVLLLCQLVVLYILSIVLPKRKRLDEFRCAMDPTVKMTEEDVK